MSKAIDIFLFQIFTVFMLTKLVFSDSRSYTKYLSCGRLYYRTLYLNEKGNHLYVGGMDIILKLNATDISMASCTSDSLLLKATNPSACITKGLPSNYQCHNHIRVIQPFGANGDKIYLCGTNAHAPQDLVINSNLTHLSPDEFFAGIGDGTAKCPFDPNDNSTAIWVQSGNPGGHPALYSGTNSEFMESADGIFRGDIYDMNTSQREYGYIRTTRYDTNMLYYPDFVGSYEIGEYVYFFFRETAMEYRNCGNAIFSRVARVCKRDTGGHHVLIKNWATYLKVRLICSIDDASLQPFFFNEIQDVYKSPGDDSVFHAVFTTGEVGLGGSAICSFRLDDIQAAFNGNFKGQASSTSYFEPVKSSDVPEPRPGTCVDDTKKLKNKVLNFIRQHVIMNDDVSGDFPNEPVFYQSDVVFTRIVTHRLQYSSSGGGGGEAIVYYAGTADGRVFKISRWSSRDGQSHSQLLDTFQVTSSPEPIRAMIFSASGLIVTSDQGIYQLDIYQMCSVRYSNCIHCSRDPYCGWDIKKNVCVSFHLSKKELLLSDPTNEISGICAHSITLSKLKSSFGQSVYMSCHILGPLSTSAADRVSWWHSSVSSSGPRFQRIFSNRKAAMTVDGGLVIINVNSDDAGSYECRISDQSETVINRYILEVDSHTCLAPSQASEYEKIYANWCQQFQKYKNALKIWEDRQTDCLKAVSNVHNQIYSHTAAEASPSRHFDREFDTHNL